MRQVSLVIPGTSLLILVLIAGFSPSRALAADWQVVGSRQRAMGGAGVATTDDTSAMYWNPAALGTSKKWGIRIDADAGFELAPGTSDEIEALVADIQDIQDNPVYDDIQDIQTRLNDGTATEQDLIDMLSFTLIEFSDLQRHDLGMFTDANGGLRVHMGKFAFSASAMAHLDTGFVADLQGLALSAAASNPDALDRLNDALAGATVQDYSGSLTIDEQALASDLAVIIDDGINDPANADLMAQTLVYLSGVNGANADTSDPNVQAMLTSIVEATVYGDDVILDNGSGIHARGVVVAEYAFGASLPIIEKQLHIGGVVKLMNGTTIEGEAGYDPAVSTTTVEEAVQVLIDDIDANGQLETQQVGIDLGLLWTPNKYLSVGITGRNLNSPEFELPASGDMLPLRPQWRAGVAVKPASWITAALDVDVTENYSQIAEDFGTRFYAFGVELSLLKVLQVRAGTYGNLLVDDALPAYTAGIGVKLGSAMSIDIAANLNGDIQAISEMYSGGTFDFAGIPEAAGVSVSMQFNTTF